MMGREREGQNLGDIMVVIPYKGRYGREGRRLENGRDAMSTGLSVRHGWWEESGGEDGR